MAGPPLWYTRPVLFVSDIHRSARFYTETLGFTKAWHEAEGGGKVCQVARAGCDIILCEEARADRGRLFLELDVAGAAQWQREMASRSIVGDRLWWGADCIRVLDPDGNELLFSLPDGALDHRSAGSQSTL